MNKIKFIFFLSLIFCVPGIQAQTVGTEIGNKAPEIRLPSPKGDTIALSSLKGKVVLIDFWATWCAPCVNEQPELRKLYEKYKDAGFTKGQGFEIYGVSLDSKKANWEGMISKANITWIQVSDLKFWSSPVAKLYNIQELPFNLLIDGNGIIFAKNLHGEELEKELERYLKVH
jgi:peroxiredoxin